MAEQVTVTHVVEGTSAPASPPPSIGAHYVNTVNGDQYLAKGAASVDDWVLQTAGLTKAEADNSYQPKGAYLTVAEAAEAFQPKGSYATAQQLANKVDAVEGMGLSSNDFTGAEKQKLSALEGSRYRGTFVSLAALQAAVPAGAAGDYADVDAGAGEPVARYLWDASDSQWTAQQAAAGPLTAAQVKELYEANPDTNVFTDQEKAKLQVLSSGGGDGGGSGGVANKTFQRVNAANPVVIRKSDSVIYLEGAGSFEGFGMVSLTAPALSEGELFEVDIISPEASPAFAVLAVEGGAPIVSNTAPGVDLTDGIMGGQLGWSMASRHQATLRITGVPSEGGMEYHVDARFKILPPKIGQPYLGGYYAGPCVSDGTPYHLIVAAKEQEVLGLQWKADATETEPTSLDDGASNTAFLELSGDHPAAQYCADRSDEGRRDWYLPSREELSSVLRRLWSGLAELPAEFQLGGSQAIGSGEYWSSTTDGATQAVSLSVEESPDIPGMPVTIQSNRLVTDATMLVRPIRRVMTII